MLDIQFIRENAELVQEKSKQKQVNVDIKELLDLDEKRRKLLTSLEELRAEQNSLVKDVTGKPSEADIKKGSELKAKAGEVEKEFEPVNKKFEDLLRKVPNIPTDDVPVGETEADNKIVFKWGDIKEFDFKPLTHWDLGESRGLIDKERATKVSGSRFTYLIGDLVQLQFALVQFVMHELSSESVIEDIIQSNRLNLVAKPFVPLLPPVMIKTDTYQATGRLKPEEVTYKLADDDLWMSASAEHGTVGMYQNEIIDEADLPIRYIGYSTNFRREVGSYGKDANGILRLHHFDKLEMEAFSSPETALDEHYLQIAIQKHLMQRLGIPFEEILKCTADIGDANARGVDLNAWFPGEGEYKETHSADYMSDYQARDLKTRMRRKDGKIELIHTNDATAFAMGRILAAIIENYQTHDKHVIVPEVLRPYLGKEEI